MNNNLRNNNEFEEITIETGKNEEKTGLINKSNILFEYNGYKNYFFGKKITTIKNLYIKWLHWEISTFTLLNYLNIFSSRSYHDINQYPVFPWIITDYTGKTIPDLSKDNNPLLNTSKDYVPKIRPLNTPMGMIDVLPTLVNMLGVYSDYSLGQDIMGINKDDGIVVFKDASFITDKIYYSAKNSESYAISGSIISDDYISSRSEYANKINEISDNIITYDLIKELEARKSEN